MKKRFLLLVFLFILGGLTLTACKQTEKPDPSASGTTVVDRTPSVSDTKVINPTPSVIDSTVVDPTPTPALKFDVFIKVSVLEETEQIFLIVPDFEAILLEKHEDETWRANIKLEPGTYNYKYLNGDLDVYVELDGNDNAVNRSFEVMANGSLYINDAIVKWKYDLTQPIPYDEFQLLAADDIAVLEGVVLQASGIAIAIYDGENGLHIKFASTEDIKEINVGDLIRLKVKKKVEALSKFLDYHVFIDDYILISTDNPLPPTHDMDIIESNSLSELHDYLYNYVNLTNLTVISASIGSGGSLVVKFDTEYRQISISFSYELAQMSKIKGLKAGDVLNLNHLFIDLQYNDTAKTTVLVVDLDQIEFVSFS